MIFYRYDARSYSTGCDDDGYGGSTYHVLDCHEYELVRETPKGYWIKVFMQEHWISKTARKRYAYPTKEEALEGFIQRKKSAAGHAMSRLGRQKTYLLLGEQELEKLNGQPPRYSTKPTITLPTW